MCLPLMLIRGDWIFACVITGYGMLIVLSGGLWDVTHSQRDTHTHFHKCTHAFMFFCRSLFAAFPFSFLEQQTHSWPTSSLLLWCSVMICIKANPKCDCGLDGSRASLAVRRDLLTADKKENACAPLSQACWSSPPCCCDTSSQVRTDESNGSSYRFCGRDVAPCSFVVR